MHSPAFADPALMARITARALLEIGAVNFRADEPYTLTSGMKSPVYIDCRSLISHPRLRSVLMDFAVSTLYRDVGLEAFDAIAGGETAGIPFSAWIADRMELPMNYVRKKPKGFGRDAQIEGAPVEWQAGSAGRRPDHRRRLQVPVYRCHSERGRQLRAYVRAVLLRYFPPDSPCLGSPRGAIACVGDLAGRSGRGA